MKRRTAFTKGFKAGFKLFSHNLATIINTILLLIVYIIGVGITSIIAKLSGKRFFDTKLGKKTYWQKLKVDKDINEYYKQF